VRPVHDYQVTKDSVRLGGLSMCFFFFGGSFFTRNTVEYCSMKIYASDRFSSPGPCGCGVSSREHSRRSKHSDIAGGQITRKDGMMMGCTK
jgi:hypothetical protein